MHTISTSEALVRADAWTSIGSCIVLLGAPGWHNIGSSAALVRQGPSSSLGTRLCFKAPVSHTISTNEALVGADA